MSTLHQTANHAAPARRRPADPDIAAQMAAVALAIERHQDELIRFLPGMDEEDPLLMRAGVLVPPSLDCVPSCLCKEITLWGLA